MRVHCGRKKKLGQCDSNMCLAIEGLDERIEASLQCGEKESSPLFLPSLNTPKGPPLLQRQKMESREALQRSCQNVKQ
jgi:hypothetical protein